MTLRIALGSLILVVTTGCTANLGLRGDEWAKPGATVSRVTWDEINCVRDATDAGRTPDFIMGGLVDIGRYAVREVGRAASYGRCMTKKGYQAAGGAG